MSYSVHPDEIINECRRRVDLRYHPTVQTVIVGEGGDPASAMLLEIERLRACQDHLLAMNPLPTNFRSDHFWQGYPPGFRFQTVVQTVAGPAVSPQPAPPPPAPVAPQIIVVPSGGQQVVYGGSAHNPQPPTASVAYAPLPAQAAPEVSPGVPAAPAAPHASYVTHPTQTAPSGPRVVPPAGGGSAPAVPPPAPARDLVSVWSAEKEALYVDCADAVRGDSAAFDRVMSRRDPDGVTVKEFCAQSGISPMTFCQRVVSERARTIEVWKLMEGAA